MKHRQTYTQCDSEKLKEILLGSLSPEETEVVESHLSECASCAEQIQLAAVTGTSWNEAQSMLALDEFDGLPSLSTSKSLFPAEVGDREYTPTADLLAREIHGWLDPTDDPQMLGRFAGYEIVGIIGHGGMGMVLKGFEASLNRYVAIKVLAPRLAANGAARQRFAREAQAAAAVLHDNVVAIHRVDEFHGLPFLVMPYIADISLQKRINDEGPLPLAAVLRIGSQIAAGLAAAHHQGLVHRDIKPANIMLETNVERVTITDFGLARTVDDASLTKTGIIAGTPQYMSPEQARGESVDQRSDLFSLGSVLYTMCTGRAPFRAETSYGVLRHITEEGTKPIQEINPDILEWLCQIVGKLMSKQPDNRFQSAGEVAELLEECLAHVQQPTAVPLPHSRVFSKKNQPHRASSRFSREPWASARRLIQRRSIGVITMIAVFGLALLGMFLWQSTDPPDIAGRWAGEGWGDVLLELEKPGKYDGTYTDTSGKEDGTIQLKWSRIERRFKGTWGEGKDRYGKISVRLVDGEIRGAWTTNKKSEISPGTPELADLLWVRQKRWVRRKEVNINAEDHFEVEGIVLAVANGQVEISMGHDDGIRRGMSLNVTNDRIDRGRIEIIGVDFDTSVGRIVEEDAKSPIRTRDRVIGSIPFEQRKTRDDGRSFPFPRTNSGLRPAFRIHPEGRVGTLAYSPDGKTLAVGAGWATVRLYDAQTGKSIMTPKLFNKEEEAILASARHLQYMEAGALAFSPDSSVLAVGHDIGQVKLFDARTGDLRLSLDDVVRKTERLQLASRSYAASAGCGASPYRNACSCTIR